MIDPNDARTRLRDHSERAPTGRSRAGPGPRFTHPCTGGSSAAFSVILDMATETRDATPTRGEESARVGRNGLKIRPRARIRSGATRRVRCTATRRVVFAWVRLLADTRKSPGLSPPKFEILLFLKARKLAVGAAVHDAQSGFFVEFLDFEFATTAGAWIGIFRNFGCLFDFCRKADRSGRTDEFSHTQGEMERCCIAPRVLRGPREPSMPPKKKKATTMKGRIPRAMATSLKAKATGPSASTHFLLLQQCVPEIFATTTVLTLARHLSPGLTPASILSTGPSTASMS